MDVVALIATVPRPNKLSSISLPSIKSQDVQPTCVVIVQDHEGLTEPEISELQEILTPTPMYLLSNKREKGAAGTWNTGIDYIAKQFDECYVAILDDDDAWLPNHISSCLEASNMHSSDVVLSGIRATKKNTLISEAIPLNVSEQDFLVGNPGWQGSNTFIRCSTLIEAGGFTGGMISSNDKDLAIRVLSLPCLNVTYTGISTVIWNFGDSDKALSAPSSPQKLRGSAQFLKYHASKMSKCQLNSYFRRMGCLFGLSKTDILKELNNIS